MQKAKELNPTTQQYGVLRTLLRISFQSVKGALPGAAWQFLIELN
jgi:hypothetical protein